MVLAKPYLAAISNICLLDSSSSPKYILYWNDAYGSTQYGFCCGQTPFTQQKCPVSNCHSTDNRSLLASVDMFDAIVFHQRSLNANDLPEKRSPRQRYVMFMLESASYPLGFDG